ncbi:MAG: thioredoxin-like domain-containing protein [Planctomycetota bacterium]|nr:thioredoxin-like domain-containing protein [Planctomycetota bacterium]MDA1026898.1 thioredoxin-like domain-containing protein [Planctomycetota bacterium]
MHLILASLALAATSFVASPQDAPAIQPAPTKAPAKEVEAGGNAKLASMIGATLEDKSGKSFKTADVLKGKKHVLLYFSAGWCGPCRVFTPDLVKFAKANADAKDFAIIFVSSDRTKDAQMEYLKKYNMPFFTIPFDAPGNRAVQLAYAGSGIPNLVVLDDSGNALKGSYETDGKYTPKNRESYVGPQKVLAAFPEMRTKTGPKG